LGATIKKNVRRFCAPQIYHGSTTTKLETRVYGCDEKFRKFRQKKVFREIRCDAKSPRQVNWAPIFQLQIHTLNPYSVDEEKEYVDGKFQEFEIIDEEFESECVEDEDPSQGFVD
jgi:hypothetical protein